MTHNKSICIRFKGKLTTIDTHPEDASLYNAATIAAAAEVDNLHQPNQFLRKKKVQKEFGATNKKVYTADKGTLTYISKDCVIAYAAWIDEDFAAAVREVFILAAEGNANAAVDAAAKVFVDPKLIEKEKLAREDMMVEVTKLVNKTGDKKWYMHYNKLACRIISGYIPSHLTGGTHSTFKYLLEMGHTSGLSAYIATLEMITRGLKLGLDYHSIAFLCQTQTTKNKHLF